jgi:salicylate hydroxylase
VLIAGGGIGGLALALALAKRGIACHVLERRAAFSEAGAGIQIGPNGTKILAEIGAAGALAPLAAAPDALRILDATTGKLVARLPLGRWIEARHGAPYWTAHRQDLHGALLAGACREPLVTISSGADVAAAESGGAAALARAADGRTWTGDALVAAEGLWSPLRTALFQSAPPRPAGKTAARAVIPMESVAEGALRHEVCLWLGPRTHAVHYPVRAGAELALVVVFEDSQVSTDWGRPLERAAIEALAARFPPPLRALTQSVPAWRAWSLHDLAPLPPFAKGRIALLGDAAHPVLPFLAQGAILALEDAVVLADCVAAHDDIPTALGDYEQRRRRRVRRLAHASRLNGAIYHLSGIIAALRNAMLAALPPERLMAGFDWVYGWEPQAMGNRQ